MTDIDIDFADAQQALEGVRAVQAVQRKDRRPHKSGYYFQDIPVDPLDELAVWDFKEAEERGYFKIDFLNNSIYQGVRDELHLIKLLTTEPPWQCFTDPAIVERLAQVHGHIDVLLRYPPHSIIDLAVCIALPRPHGQQFIGRPRAYIEPDIWNLDPHGPYGYKKAHAIAFATSIVVQLNLLLENDVS